MVLKVTMFGFFFCRTEKGFQEPVAEGRGWETKAEAP